MRKCKQQSVAFRKNGILYHWVVVANVETNALHFPASAYFFAREMNGARPHTLNSYASVLKSLFEEVEIDAEIEIYDDLTDAHMTEYLEAVLHHERSASASTIHFHTIVLKGCFKLCHEHGYFDKPERFSYHASRDLRLKQKKISDLTNSLNPYKPHHKYIPPFEFDELLHFEPSKTPYNIAPNDLVLRLG